MSTCWFVRRVLLMPVIVTTLAAAATAAAASPTPAPWSVERDWLVADELAPTAGVSAVHAPSTTGNPCPGCSAGKVVYTAFESYDVTLNRFFGRHVEVLLPDAWVERLSEEERAGLVESVDRAYELLRDLTGREPLSVDYVPTIAFVPSTCGIGCGVIGHGRAEIWDGHDDSTGEINEAWVDELRTLAAEATPHVVVSHELTHNFDVYASHLWYHADSAHWWTDLVNVYTYPWGMLESLGPVGSGFLQGHRWFEQEAAWLDALRGSYLTDPSHGWATCVRDESCEGIVPKRARAAVSWEILRQLGPGVLPATLDFLGATTAGSPAPDSPGGKEELWLEALAAGAGADLNACLDQAAWRNSQLLANRMAAHGPPAPLCQDADGDGFSPYAGDCDDGNALVGPHAAEIPGNGADDDCNRLVDEAVATPGGASGSIPAPPFAVQTQVDGQSLLYRFDPARAGRVVMRACSPADGYQGWFALWNPTDFDATYWRYQRAGGCTSGVARLDTQKGWQLYVQHNSHEAQPGAVEVTVGYTADWPAPWGSLRVSQLDDRRLALEATVADPSSWRAPAATVRFELSGFGRVGTAPVQNGRARLEWTAPTDLEPGHALFAFAQPVAAGVPAAPGLRKLFRPIDVRPCVPGPDTACLLDGRFEVTGTMENFTNPPKSFDLAVMDFPGGRAESQQAAFFDSFTPGNFEIGVKMVDGCTLPDGHPNRAFWLFVGGLTTAESLVRVEDAATGAVYEWTNPKSNLPQTLADTQAFPCGGSTPPQAACPYGSHQACLLDRFKVSGVMKDFANPPAEHQLRVMSFPGGRAESAQAAFFHSFTPGNFEMGVKMVNGCTLPPGNPGRAYWLFVGGLTTAATHLEARQVSTGEVVTWSNPKGNLPRSTADTAAFACE